MNSPNVTSRSALIAARGLILAVMAMVLMALHSSAATAEDERRLRASATPEMDRDLFNFDGFGEYRWVIDGPFDSMAYGSVAGSVWANERITGGLFLGGGSIQTKENFSAGFLEFGLVGRFHLTKEHVFLRPYLSAGVSFMYLSGEIADTDPDTEFHTNGLGGFGGGGLSVRLSRRISAFGEVTVGGVADLRGQHVGPELNIGYTGVKVGLSATF